MFKHYVKRTIKKLFAIPLWIVFNLIYFISKPISAVLHLLSLPVSLIVLVVAIITYFNEGFSSLTTMFLIVSIAMAVIYAIAPYITVWAYRIKTSLKEVAFKPIVIRPPVRYTIDSLYL